jgi:hypothetical protein
MADVKLPAGEEGFLLLLAHRLAPGSQTMSTEEVQAFFAAVRRTLGARPRALQLQFALFLSVVRWLPALRYGGPIERLSPEDQDAALRWFQSAPIGLLRKGFWGLKTIVYLGYYGQPEIAARLGWKPAKDGNAYLLITKR